MYSEIRTMEYECNKSVISAIETVSRDHMLRSSRQKQLCSQPLLIGTNLWHIPDCSPICLSHDYKSQQQVSNWLSNANVDISNSELSLINLNYYWLLIKETIEMHCVRWNKMKIGKMREKKSREIERFLKKVLYIFIYTYINFK